MRSLAAVSVLVAMVVWSPTAGGVVGGDGQVPDDLAAPIAFVEITTHDGALACTGTLISPTVVMTAAHCMYEGGEDGSPIGVANPWEISVRVGSSDVSNASLGVAAGVVAVLPQPYYRWDGTRRFHDVALLALDRAMPQVPAVLAEQRPEAGKPLLIAGYGRTASSDHLPPAALRTGLIEAADPASCRLASEAFDPAWLFCGAASTEPAIPGGRPPATAIRADRRSLSRTPSGTSSSRA